MMGLTLLSLGVEPENATVDDATRAQDKLLEANERDQFRGYYGNEYYDALAAGDLALVGGLVRRRHPDAAERQPERRSSSSPRPAACAGTTTWRSRRAPRASTMPTSCSTTGTTSSRATPLSEYIGYFTPVDGRPASDPRRRRGRSRGGRHGDRGLLRGARRRRSSRPRTSSPTPSGQAADRGGGGGVERPLPRGHRRLTARRQREPPMDRRGALGWPRTCSCCPGGLWLLVFFVIPMAIMLGVSLQEGSLDTATR